MRLANQHYYIIGGFYCKLKRLLSTCIAGGFFKDCLTKNSDTVRGVITYLQYRCFPVDSIYNNRSHNYHSLCETKQNIFLYTTMLYRVFDLLRFSGVDGSRTRVQKPIHCSSTIIVDCFGFPHSLRHKKINILMLSVASCYAHSLKALTESFPTWSKPGS